MQKTQPCSFLEELLSVLSLLAASPETQLSYLKNLGIEEAVDELALEFDDVWLQCRNKLQEGLLTETQFTKIENLSVMLDKMSGGENSRMWTEVAVRGDRQWSQIRETASRCIVEFLAD